MYKGVWKEETVAVKVCRQQHITVKAMKQFQKEVAILYGCNNESIVQFKGACCWKVSLACPGSIHASQCMSAHRFCVF